MLFRPLLLVSIAASAAFAQDTAPKSTGEAWQIIPLPQSSRVFARDGSLIGEIGREFRTNVALKSLPAHVWQAFVATEDQRFFEHDGVDVKAVGAAVVGKILRKNRGGGSTITCSSILWIVSLFGPNSTTCGHTLAM